MHTVGDLCRYFNYDLFNIILFSDFKKVECPLLIRTCYYIQLPNYYIRLVHYLFILKIV